MAYGESNDYVTDDVTWPSMVKFITPMHIEVFVYSGFCWQLLSVPLLLGFDILQIQ